MSQSKPEQPPGMSRMMWLGKVFDLVQWVVLLLGIVAILRWGVLPIATEIKGTSTSFDFSFGLTLSLAVNLALGGGLILSEVDRRAVKKKLTSQRAGEHRR